MDGMRKCLTEEYSHLYILNLRGDQRKSGEESKREGGKIFGSGSRTPVAVTIMVKDPTHTGSCDLHYHDIGDYLSQEEKLNLVDEFRSIDSVTWQKLAPNDQGDWANQRDPAFDEFIPLGDKDVNDGRAIFDFYSLGVTTNRDPWAYNMGSEALERNMRRMIDAFNADSARYARLCRDRSRDQWPKIEDVIDLDSKRIGWTRALKADATKGKQYVYDSASMTLSTYRPFTKQWLYFSRRFNEMVYRIPNLFPTPRHENVVISSTGVADRKGYSALVADHVPNLHLTDTGQCFPLYWYDLVDANTAPPQGEIFSVENDVPDADGYVRREAITDWSLNLFCEHYQDRSSANTTSSTTSTVSCIRQNTGNALP